MDDDMTASAQPPLDPVEAAEQAVVLLRHALEAAGVALPDLGVDGCTCGYVVVHRPMVELGRVAPDVAIRLAGVLARGALAS
ncbi:hypothetical protein [Streptomyces sp. Z26]|uniref:hypothetical protein n=1 Tax=Streptomyces sp. Z26 TaxID=2500177 RepID=UPI000EF14201|nr:hypothetical protein [Streptomyces sp. Z26]RLL67052.1 hypothetical protein D7M15_09445 [Streptomyces sp. Z26]